MSPDVWNSTEPGEQRGPTWPVRPHASDFGLVQRVLQGDAAALENLITRLRCVPAFLAARNVQLGIHFGSHEIEDLAQDTLVAVWRKLPEYRGDARIESWVCQFCEFQLRNARRRRAARRREAEAFGVVTDNDVVEPLDAGVDLEAVHLALHGLPEDEALVVRLKHFDGRTFDEIAVLLGGSPNTAKTRYDRALEHLRGVLRRREGGMR